MWLARDDDETLWLFNAKPELIPYTDDRVGGYFIASDEEYSQDNLELPRALFRNVTFKNSPVEVELIMQDSLSKQLELEYKRGICEGENYPIWHKYPEEQPDKYDDYLTQSEFHCISIAHYNMEGWHNNVGGNVVAWMKLPKPYEKESNK